MKSIQVTEYISSDERPHKRENSGRFQEKEFLILDSTS